MDVREKLVEILKQAPFEGKVLDEWWWEEKIARIATHLIAHGVTVIPPEGIGEMSDGYHTFNELYHHRAVLFSVICNAMPDKAWKSKRHDTGDMYDGMFIVGIETNHGQATYHYDVDPYWDMFNVPELEYAPKWDGHTPQEAINRIANGVTVQEWISVKDRLPDKDKDVWCYSNKNGGYMFIGYRGYISGDWMDGGSLHIGDVTHWMELPEPPKEV